jgi:hypothetical protein
MTSGTTADDPTGTTGTTGTAGTTTGPGTTSTTDAPTTTASPPDLPDLTTTGTTDGAGFVSVPDGGGSCVAAFGEYQVRCTQCDPWAQDCPPGHKCAPFAEDGGPEWDDLKCVPLFEDLAQPGQPCTVEGYPTSGNDDCDLGSICFFVDPDTLAGTCVPQCDGSIEAPECGPDRACRISHDGVLALCLPMCDPQLDDCPEGQVCTANDDPDQTFVCAPA